MTANTGRTVAVIQARMGSSRLPGKTIAPICGYPMLELLIRRIASAELDEIVVAASEREIDDPIEELVQSLDIATIVRGSESDVLSRFVLAIERTNADTVIRLTGDNPTVDASCIDAGLKAYRSRGGEPMIYTNHDAGRTDPYGLGLELFSADVLMTVAQGQRTEHDREHVTPAIYDRCESGHFRILPGDYSHLRWTVDTAEDMESARRRFEACGAFATVERLAQWESASRPNDRNK